MIRLNIRKGESTIRFGSPTWLTINNVLMPIADVLAMLSPHPDGRLKTVCVLAPGFNVVEPMPPLALVNDNIEKLYDVVIALTWPGSFTPTGFWFAEKRADMAGRILATLLAGLPKIILSAQGHSCGCRLLLEMVKTGVKVKDLILAAAAVDNETVHIDQKYGKALEANVERCLVAHSRNDGVLRRAFRWSSMTKRIISPANWGDDCCALGYTGPQDPTRCPPIVASVDLTRQILKHGDYKYQEAYFAAWRALAER